jgi:acyl carrier protein
MKWSERLKALSPQQRVMLQARLERISATRPAAAPSLSGPERLAGYIVCRPGKSLTPEELDSFLRDRVPEHMVPSLFVFLDALPLMANGKVDRRALRDTALPPKPHAAPSPPVEPSGRPANPIEEELVKIWREVLGLSEVGVRDNFFNLGGHSLLVLRVLARIRKAFQTDLPLKTLFESPTVEKLAAAVASARQKGTNAPIKKISRLTPGQFNTQREPDSENEATLRK